jgi:hypothetical protein
MRISCRPYDNGIKSARKTTDFGVETKMGRGGVESTTHGFSGQ